MYTRVTLSESWLVVVEKVVFIDEIIDTAKDQFFKERHWTRVIYYLLRVFLCTGNVLPLLQSSAKTPC